MLRCAVFLFLVVALPLRANLGETVAECVKRYGKPMMFTEANAKSPFGTLVFVAGPYQMIIFLHEGAEVGARVSKKDKSAFTPAEMKVIMDADTTTPWVAAANADAGTLQWTRDDKSTVLYDTDKKMLIFTSPQMLAALHEQPPVPPPASEVSPEPAPMTNRNIVIAPPVPTQWAPSNAPAPTNAATATSPGPAAP